MFVRQQGVARESDVVYTALTHLDAEEALLSPLRSPGVLAYPVEHIKFLAETPSNDLNCVSPHETDVCRLLVYTTFVVEDVSEDLELSHDGSTRINA